MSSDLLTLLSVVEIVALVVVLALFLNAIGNRLRSISANLGILATDLQEVDRHVAAIEPTAVEINAPLQDITGALPHIADRAEKLARR